MICVFLTNQGLYNYFFNGISVNKNTILCYGLFYS